MEAELEDAVRERDRLEEEGVEALALTERVCDLIVERGRLRVGIEREVIVRQARREAELERAGRYVEPRATAPQGASDGVTAFPRKPGP